MIIWSCSLALRSNSDTQRQQQQRHVGRWDAYGTTIWLDWVSDEAQQHQGMQQSSASAATR
jgi:hypothetical protein